MDPLDTIREIIGRLTTITADELAELRTQILAAFEGLDTDEATVEQIAQLQELAEFGEQAMAEQASRDTQAAQAQSDREAARQRIAALNPEPEAEPEAEPETDPEAEVDPEAEPETEVDPAAAEPVPEPVAAGGAVARMAARQAAPTPSPEATPPARRRATLVAAGALRGGRLDPTAPLDDPAEFAVAMAETLMRLPRHGAPRGDVLLASARWSYPEERQLGSDAWENSRKMDAVTNPKALVATGGICAPTNVDYSLENWATADRPLRDALPGFEATRGGILFVQPISAGALSGATGIWTEATDASPGASVKPVVSIQCGSTVQVYVEAISTRLGFGNMQSRFAPEQVALNTEIAIVDAARVAENNLLNLIAAVAMADVTTSTSLGATRDLLMAIDQAVAAYRNLHRIPRSQRISAIFPEWIKDLLRVDLLREIGHDNSGPRDSLAVTDAQVVELMEAHGVNPIFHLDGQPSGVSGGVAQTFVAQTASGAIKPFPTTCVWYMYAEGMLQFLDGGRLALGVVRDSTLDATNDYETFVETFEAIADRGFANGVIQFVSTLCASGGSAGTQNTQSGTSTTCP